MTAPAPFRFQVVKTYPRRGPLQQHRAANATAFVCFRCRQEKIAKLIATSGSEDPTELLCNGCYGYLLSVWTLRSHAEPDPEQDKELLEMLASAVTASQIERGRAVLGARLTQLGNLSPETQTLLGTAEAVHVGITPWRATDLDWSAAALPLCKAVEIEIDRLIAQPLKAAAQGLNLDPDVSRPGLRTMVDYCRAPAPRPLMLGPFARFLQGITAFEAANGHLVAAVRTTARPWPSADWLFDPDGLAASLDILRRRFRNPVAHTEILGRAAYEDCAEFVIGADGLLWRLLVATKRR